MPKQKCRANRKARRKRDRKLLARLVGERFDDLVLSADGGKSPDYYEVRYRHVKLVHVAGARQFDVRKIRCRVVPKPELHRLIAQLRAAIPPGLTVAVPRSVLFDEPKEETP